MWSCHGKRAALDVGGGGLEGKSASLSATYLVPCTGAALLIIIKRVMGEAVESRARQGLFGNLYAKQS